MLTPVLTTTLAAVLLSASAFGGPIYSGPPDTPTTAALVYAGGGARVYTATRAYNAILGVQLLDPEIENLQKHYGVPAVALWMHIATFVVRDAVGRRSPAGHHHLPLPPGPLVGKRLTTALIGDGTGPDGAFWTGLWLDKLFSHAVHVRVMKDVDARFGSAGDATFNRVNNQAMYDIDHQTGGSVGLASYH